MGAPVTVQQPAAPPPPVDVTKMQIAGIAKAQTDKRLRESRGRRSAFLFDDDVAPRQPRPVGGRAPGSVGPIGA